MVRGGFVRAVALARGVPVVAAVVTAATVVMMVRVVF